MGAASNTRANTSEIVSTPLRIIDPPKMLRSGPEIDVSLLLELHHPDDAALRQDERLGRQLLRGDAEILHGVATRAEGHALHLQRLQRLRERRIHRALHERLQRRSKHDELEGLDVLPSSDPGDVVADIPQDELRLVHARVVELIEDLVLLGVLPQMGRVGLNQRRQDAGDREKRNPTAPNFHSTSWRDKASGHARARCVPDLLESRIEGAPAARAQQAYEFVTGAARPGAAGNLGRKTRRIVDAASAYT